MSVISHWSLIIKTFKRSEWGISKFLKVLLCRKNPILVYKNQNYNFYEFLLVLSSYVLPDVSCNYLSTYLYIIINTHLLMKL